MAAVPPTAASVKSDRCSVAAAPPAGRALYGLDLCPAPDAPA
jgi:hypothetical protein